MTVETLQSSEVETAQPVVVTRRAGPALRPGTTERWPRQLLFIVLALALVAGFLYATHAYWVPAHPGVDQNGYLVGGRLFAETMSMGFAPGDPFAFVGRMWIGTPRGEFYPKYPLGFPLLVATMFWVGGDALGPSLAYWINPVCMSVALLGTFLLCRMLAGSFAGVVGMILFATSPVTLMLTNNPNSHASTVACVVWGIYFLLQWWKRGGKIVACLAGFLLGFAAMIRYTEGLLLLPIVLVIAFKISDFGYGILDWKRRFRLLIQNPKSAIQNSLEPALLLASWAFPLVVLVCFNLHWFGALTGYDSTHESTGFSWDWFKKNWSTMLTQLNAVALYFVLPLAVLGLVRVWGRDWKLAAVFTAWIFPSTLLYISYYWAPDGITISYMRFMLTIMPAMVACAVWFLADFDHRHFEIEHPRPRRAAFQRTMLLGIVGALGGVVSLSSAAVMLENDHRTNLVLAGVTAQARSAGVDAGALVIADERLLHHLQFVIKDLHLYSPDVFNRAAVMRMVENAQSDPNAPQGLQPDRALSMGSTIGPMSDMQLIERQNQILDQALGQGRKAFLIGPKRSLDTFREKFLTKKVTRRANEKNARPVTETVDKYEVNLLKKWDETSDLRRDRAQRWALPFQRARAIPNMGPVEWQVIEVKALPPPATSQPTTQGKG